MNAEYAGKLGKGLGDRVRVNEQDWLSKLSQNGSPFEPGETLEELRDRKRPFLTVVGLIRGDPEDHTLYVPTEANYAVHCLYTGNFTLDIARCTLNDYFLAAEFRDYAKSIVDVIPFWEYAIIFVVSAAIVWYLISYLRTIPLQDPQGNCDVIPHD